MSTASPTIAVIGLGYVGLPLAVALAEHFPTAGLDIDAQRIAELREGHDRTGEIGGEMPSGSFDLILAAVPHRSYRIMTGAAIEALAAENALVADLGGIWRDIDLRADLDRWIP